VRGAALHRDRARRDRGHAGVLVLHRPAPAELPGDPPVAII
jgi:hypothetical protein